MKYYAVKHGRKPGIYTTWKDCQAQTSHFKGAIFKSFESKEEAKAWLETKTSKESKKLNLKPKQDECILFCDGSFNASTQTGGFGLVLITPNGIQKEKLAVPKEKLQNTRNFGSELYGAMSGIVLAHKKGYRKIRIFYDYQGIESFANGDWTPKNPIAQGYAKWMREYQKVMEISFQKVPAHQEVEYNEMADQLAKAACGL